MLRRALWVPRESGSWEPPALPPRWPTPSSTRPASGSASFPSSPLAWSGRPDRTPGTRLRHRTARLHAPEPVRQTTGHHPFLPLGSVPTLVSRKENAHEEEDDVAQARGL